MMAMDPIWTMHIKGCNSRSFTFEILSKRIFAFSLQLPQSAEANTVGDGD